MVRKGYVLNTASAMKANDCMGYIVETLAVARSKIKDATLFWMFQEPKVNFYRVAHIDKIAALFTISIPIRTFK